jgi:hypothetical protein
VHSQRLGPRGVRGRTAPETQQAGLILRGNRMYLAHGETRTPPWPSEDMDDWEAERWVNEIHLATDTPPDDPSRGCRWARQPSRRVRSARRPSPIPAVAHPPSPEKHRLPFPSDRPFGREKCQVPRTRRSTGLDADHSRTLEPICQTLSQYGCQGLRIPCRSGQWPHNPPTGEDACRQAAEPSCCPP